MNKLPINSDLVGLSIDPISHSWTNRDTMLYALGVGCRPPEDLDFIYEGRGPKVVPTFAVIPGLRAIPKKLGLYKVMWSDYYALVKREHGRKS